MTQELMKLKPKELAEVQKAVDIIKKVYGLSDDDIDAFFVLVHKAKALVDDYAELATRLGRLEKNILGTNKDHEREMAKLFREYMSKPVEELNTNV